jgi:beta-xylosidase
MGSPQDPTEDQVEKLNAATKLPPPTKQHLGGGQLNLSLQTNALALIEVQSRP